MQECLASIGSRARVVWCADHRYLVEGGGAVFVYSRSARKPFHVIIGVLISPIRNYKQLHFSVCNCCGLFIAGVETAALRVEKLKLLFCRTGLFLFIFSFFLLFYFAYLYGLIASAKNY